MSDPTFAHLQIPFWIFEVFLCRFVFKKAKQPSGLICLAYGYFTLHSGNLNTGKQNGPNLKMYFLLKRVIFHCYAGFAEAVYPYGWTTGGSNDTGAMAVGSLPGVQMRTSTYKPAFLVVTCRCMCKQG